MRYLYYFIRSVYYRGLWQTIRLLYYEWKGDRVYGISTGADIRTEAHNDNFHYQGASYTLLEALFKNLKTQYPDYTVYDIGCGKGRALFVAEKMGFDSLIGIDINNALVKVAEKNLETYQHKRVDSRFTFLVQNALSLNIPNTPSIFFLFNPFSAKVLKPFLQRMKDEAKAPCVVVYLNPLYESCFTETGFRFKEVVYTASYKEAVIYTL